MGSSLILSLLTDDLLERVLDCLSNDSDRKSFRATCKVFHGVESGHRTRLKFLRPEFIPGLLRNYTRADTLDFSVCPRICDGTISALLNNISCYGWAQRVKSVVLCRTTSLRSPGLEVLVGSCPGLQSVDVSHCYQFGDREAAALSCGAELREVKMDKCLRVTDVGLAKIAIGCDKLEKISLKWCLEITDLGIDLLSKKCLHLKHLSISYLKISNESLRSISNLKELEKLLMVGCGLVDDGGLHFLGNGCPSLQVLDITRCEHVSSSGLISVIRGCKGLQNLNAGYYFLLVYGRPNLKMLDLTCCDDITDVAISAIASSCRKLLCLKLESCSLLTEKSFSYLGSSCHLLEELDLTECHVNDIGLDNLSKCSELRCLKLGICTDISDTGLSYIASHCKIEELDLYRYRVSYITYNGFDLYDAFLKLLFGCRCSNVGDDGLRFLATGCKKMRKLNLSYCTKVTDKGMVYLGLLEELSDLELRSNGNVTDTGLIALASGCRKLSELDIKNCQNIGDAGFWSLAFYSWNLQQINLSYCSVSDVGLCMMMGNLTRLQDAKLVNLAKVSAKGLLQQMVVESDGIKIQSLICWG
ncbi:F-box/LRR-repeat protein 3 isoform X2 [Cynara cardunculus var. scolymus]|uniref:F-box/LRR-repeat protein 3 isoform X2 n=1 Tax=Cynara cardunculus var. scolymus TaxID=59895 RepID=UPI000D630767|nr:F-box/LRR-repeat protein 3 isoform X2 [Cynara cardunculus var. scolymus]